MILQLKKEEHEELLELMKYWYANRYKFNEKSILSTGRLVLNQPFDYSNDTFMKKFEQEIEPYKEQNQITN